MILRRGTAQTDAAIIAELAAAIVVGNTFQLRCGVADRRNDQRGGHLVRLARSTCRAAFSAG